VGVVLLTLFTAASPARAGIYADDMSRCLVEKSSPDDRVALVRWMFAAAASHPAVADIAKVQPEQIDAANRTIAELVMRLMTEACKEPTQKALKYEGPATIGLSFQVLGQVAGNELFSNPSVAAAMAGLAKYTDAEKLKVLGTE
jgi:hypothetical protein